MKLKYFFFLSFIGILVTAVVPSFAQSNPRYVRFAGVPNAVKGALYAPDAPEKQPHVGILVMHRASNFLVTLACTELSKRGFLVLCMNPRSDNNEALVRWETSPLDVKAGVEFLKNQPGLSKIILWGFSGGGPTMTFYQNVAENGVSVCQGGKKLVPFAVSIRRSSTRAVPTCSTPISILLTQRTATNRRGLRAIPTNSKENTFAPRRSV